VAPHQEIHFARSADGTRIAFATAGRGYPLVDAGHWLGHLEFDWQTPIWRPWVERLSASYRLIRYDTRGCGLSDRSITAYRLDDLVADLEAVVDGARLDRFALMGKSQGGAISIAYAAKHPERVSHIVLCGAFARGELQRNPNRKDTIDAMAQLIRTGWGRADSPFLQMFTNLFFPHADPEQMRAFNMIQHKSASPQNAALILRELVELDASGLLGRITCPTLVLHSKGDGVIPFEEGRFLASSIKDARLEPLASGNHVPLLGEPAFERVFECLRGFLPSAAMADGTFGELTVREREVLDFIARGLDNAQIAAHLALAEKTVRNHITRIFAKLAVENRPQAIVRAREAGFGR